MTPIDVVVAFTRGLKYSYSGLGITEYTEGTFFWDYSGIGLLGIDGIRVLLGAILFILLLIAE